MLGHRPNMKITLEQRLVFAGSTSLQPNEHEAFT